MMAWHGTCGWDAGGGPVLHGGFMLLLIVLLAIGLFLLWRISGRTRDARVTGSPGLTGLDERYARGEIERDEYLQKKRDIAS